MDCLKINDIQSWLQDHQHEFQKLKSQEFPPINNALYFLFIHLSEFVEYCQFIPRCNKALLELRSIQKSDFERLSNWVKSYESTGSQDLLMFEVNYLSWDEQVREDQIKIHEGIYTEKDPFISIIWFCKAFQLLYWNNSILATELTVVERDQIKLELETILCEYDLYRFSK